MKQIIDTQLPLFRGFYGTFLEGEVDDQIFENLNCSSDDLDIDYNQYQNDVSKWYTKEVEKMIQTELNINCNLVFECLHSPKFYNFENDSVYIKAIFKSKKELLKIKELIYQNFDYMRDYIKNRCSSYDGFISFYSNNIDYWETKTNKFRDFDNIELEIILEALLNLTFDKDSFMCNFYDSEIRLDNYILNYNELNELTV